MESMKCMNEGCGKTMSVCWKRGWQLKSGAFALLCLACGVAYDDSSYCSSFHKDESGWRECKFCNTPIHCGCVASKHLHKTLDAGGVGCKKCDIDTELRLTTAIPNWSIGIGSSSRLGTWLENEQVNLQPQNTGQGPFDLGKNKNCEISGSSLHPPTFRPSILSRPGSSSGTKSLSNLLDSVTRQSSDFPLSSSSSTSNNAPTHANRPENTALHFTGKMARGADKNRLRKPAINPIYIPKMTELELVQYSKALNSDIVPLFEKALSTTDVSKKGRFVVPRACAKTYFPAIKKPNGVLIQMLDIKSRKWEFELKFTPFHSDRIYFLDGARPFLLNLQLQARDTVTFSRMESSDMLVIGYRYRNATNIEEFPVNQQSQEEPSAESSSSCRVNVNIASDSVENTPLNVEKGEIPSNKRARKGKETMISTMPWKGQELLRPPVSRNRTVVMVDGDEIEEFEVPPVIGAKPTPASTSRHRGRRSRRKLQVPLKWDWGRLQSGSTSGSAQLPAGANGGTTAQLPVEANVETTGAGSDGRIADLNLTCEIQDYDDLEFSDSEGIIAPENYLK